MPSAAGVSLGPLAPLLAASARAVAPVGGFADIVARVAGSACVAVSAGVETGLDDPAADAMPARGSGWHDMTLPAPSKLGDGGSAAVVALTQPAASAGKTVVAVAQAGRGPVAPKAAGDVPVAAAHIVAQPQTLRHAAAPVAQTGQHQKANVSASRAPVLACGGVRSRAMQVPAANAHAGGDHAGDPALIAASDTVQAAPATQMTRAAVHSKRADAAAGAVTPPAAPPQEATAPAPAAAQPAPAAPQPAPAAPQPAPAAPQPMVPVDVGQKAAPQLVVQAGSLAQQGNTMPARAEAQTGLTGTGVASGAGGVNAYQEAARPIAQAGSLAQQGNTTRARAEAQTGLTGTGVASGAGGVDAYQEAAGPMAQAGAWPNEAAVPDEPVQAARPAARVAAASNGASLPNRTLAAGTADNAPSAVAPSIKPQAGVARAGNLMAAVTPASVQQHPHEAPAKPTAVDANKPASRAPQLGPSAAAPQSTAVAPVQNTLARPEAVTQTPTVAAVSSGSASPVAPAASAAANSPDVEAQAGQAQPWQAKPGPAKTEQGEAAPATSPVASAVPSPVLPVGVAAEGDPAAPALQAAAIPASEVTVAVAPMQVAARPVGAAQVPLAAPAAPAAQLGQAVAAVQIGAGASGHVTIRLQPAELGHVQISISRDGAGAASVSVAVERPETLSTLQADLGHLHQALDRAGVPDQRSVSLHLAGAQDAQSQAGQAGGGGQGAPQGSAGGFQQGSGQSRPGVPAGTDAGAAAPGGEAPAVAEPASRWVRAGVNVTA